MTTLKRKPDLAWKKIGETAVILDLDGQRDFHQLNDVAARIWELCDGHKSLAEISKVISDEFEAESGEIEQDVESFSQKLLAMNLLLED